MKLSWLPQIPALALCHTITISVLTASPSGAVTSLWHTASPDCLVRVMWSMRKTRSESYSLHRDIFWEGGTVNSHIFPIKTPGALGIVKSIYGDSFHWAGRGGNGEMSQENKQLRPLLIFMSEWLFNAFNGNLNLDSFLSLLYQQHLNYRGRKAWQRMTTAWLETKVNTLPVTLYLSYKPLCAYSHSFSPLLLTSMEKRLCWALLW